MSATRTGPEAMPSAAAAVFAGSARAAGPSPQPATATEGAGAAGSLAQALRELEPPELVELLRRRPDLVQPVPTDLAHLAIRATSRPSVIRAVDGLDRWTLQVLQSILALPDPVSVADLRSALLGVAPAATAAGRHRNRAGEPVGEAVDRLRGRALIWGPDDALSIVRVLPEILGPHPAGLAPSFRTLLASTSPARVADLAGDLGLPRSGDPVTDAEAIAALLSDPVEVQALIDDAVAVAGQGAAEVLDRLRWGPPTGRVDLGDRPPGRAEATSPVAALVARGLLVAVDSRTVTMPLEVALYLRGGRTVATPEPVPPLLAAAAAPAKAPAEPAGEPAGDTAPPRSKSARSRPTRHDGGAAVADSRGLGAVLEVLRFADSLVASWANHPPAVLRAGGVGVRDLRRTAGALGTDEATTALLVEVLGSASLVAEDDEGWLPTAAYDAWAELDPARRWTTLAAAWLSATRAAGMVGQRIDSDRIAAPLGPDLDNPLAVGVRTAVLEGLAALPAGDGPAQPPEGGPDAATELVVADAAWRLPRRSARLRDDLARWTLAEAATLGVVGGRGVHAALTTWGRALLSGDQAAAAAALTTALPEPVEQIVLQADLTAVAPGMLHREVATELGLIADVESAGAATVYRFSTASIRRALDAGRSSTGIHAFLTTHSATAVPQPLTYLVDDVARRHGAVRVGSISAYVRCEDPAVLAALVADRRVASLRLRSLAPTVAVTEAPVELVLDRLRTSGHSPAAEGADGAVVVAGGEPDRAPVPLRRPGTGERVPDERMLAAAAAALLAGDRAVRARPRGTLPPPGSTPTPNGALAVLRRALGNPEGSPVRSGARPGSPLSRRPEPGRPVWIGYTDSTGTVGERIVEPVRIDGGVLTALDRRDAKMRTFALHRITAAALVDDDLADLPEAADAGEVTAAVEVAVVNGAAGTAEQGTTGGGSTLT